LLQGPSICDAVKTSQKKYLQTLLDFRILYHVCSKKPTFITMASIIGTSLDNGPFGSGNVEVNLKIDIYLEVIENFYNTGKKY